MLRCVDIYAIMPDSSRRLSFTGSVQTTIERHWVKQKPKEDVFTDMLLDADEIGIPMIFPGREKMGLGEGYLESRVISPDAERLRSCWEG